ncbi:methylamine utilization protein [Stieleria sp. TO1_6]|uniref:methylamine utilization protein n=1 Tax=Stieleria tagensis TaxID=2956795 RepID=UPI00209A765F|nr:methylamine utilization protein [Stieleria tagensis]MCO8120312.1 methylamine utilization protein [Stieleria tagensis]
MNQIVFSASRLVCVTAGIVVGLSLGLSPAMAQETGTLRMTFKYKGAAEAPAAIVPNVDQAFCGQKKIFNESLVVNPENNGIRDVIVYVYTGRRGTDLPEMKLEPKTHVLANEDCRFEPHVVLAKKGDTIKVTNPDKVGHNANFQGFNISENPTIPAGAEVDIKLEDTEPSVIPVSCNIHNWMQARLLVVDHPFAASSDKDGVLEITGLPVGKEIIFRANHEKGSLTDVIVDGKSASWRASKFEVEIKPGMNDMGTIEVPAAAFE